LPANPGRPRAKELSQKYRELLPTFGSGVARRSYTPAMLQPNVSAKSGLAPMPPKAHAEPRPELRVTETAMSGCFTLEPTVRGDVRGSFTKLFHQPLWQELGLRTDFVEEYVTVSTPGTIRGMHFQVPPMEGAKVVFCLQGDVWDVALDLRAGSSRFGEHIAFELKGARGDGLYLPPGIAHGFCVLGSAPATLLYKVTSVYSPQHDLGLRWDSAGIAWPVDSPVLSERDHRLPRLCDFETPFKL
jgi:dTDP-4-dehydrorhamnose 3,5-epimerase